MDSNALEQERGITIYAKNTSIEYNPQLFDIRLEFPIKSFIKNNISMRNFFSYKYEAFSNNENDNGTLPQY